MKSGEKPATEEEPILKSAGSVGGAEISSANDQEATPPLSNIPKQGRSAAAVNATPTTGGFGATQQTLQKQYNTEKNETDQSKCFEQGGNQDFYALPSRLSTSGRVQAQRRV